jgi:hypothetical protein
MEPNLKLDPNAFRQRTWHQRRPGERGDGLKTGGKFYFRLPA